MGALLKRSGILVLKQKFPQDADSLEKTSGEKKEGEFYVWRKAEIDEVLGGEDSGLSKRFASFYNIQSEGNTTLSQMRQAMHSSRRHLICNRCIGAIIGDAAEQRA